MTDRKSCTKHIVDQAMRDVSKYVQEPKCVRDGVVKKPNAKLIHKLIDEYIGKHFRFLSKFINGGYESYVLENLHTITHKNIFGKTIRRREYNGIYNPYELERKVLQDCEDTLNYIKSNLDK